MLKVNALGDPCPIPVVKTKNAIKDLQGKGIVETLVDNEIAVQNLTKIAVQKGYGVNSEKLGDNLYRVLMQIGTAEYDVSATSSVDSDIPATSSADNDIPATSPADSHPTVPAENRPSCLPCNEKKTVVIISSDKMGEGNDDLGQALMKSFLFALSQLDDLPSAILFYNGGARLTCAGSSALEDIKNMEEEGVEILTCGTCLNHYGLTEQLSAGSITNMYAIVELMMQADHIIKP